MDGRMNKYMDLMQSECNTRTQRNASGEEDGSLLDMQSARFTFHVQAKRCTDLGM